MPCGAARSPHRQQHRQRQRIGQHRETHAPHRGQHRHGYRQQRLRQQAPGARAAPGGNLRQRGRLHAAPAKQQAGNGGCAHQQRCGRCARQRPGQHQGVAHGGRHDGHVFFFRICLPGMGMCNSRERQRGHQLDGQHKGQLDQFPGVVEGGQSPLARPRGEGSGHKRQGQG